VLSPLSTLQQRALAQPAAWAPVAAQLLLSYGRGLGAGVLLEWGAELEAAAAHLFPSPNQLAPLLEEQDPGGRGFPGWKLLAGGSLLGRRAGSGRVGRGKKRSHGGGAATSPVHPAHAPPHTLSPAKQSPCCWRCGADGTLWALRFAHALALAWPLQLSAAVLTGTTAGAGPGAEAKQEASKSQSLWKV
jgi:hypothetical protein